MKRREFLASLPGAVGLGPFTAGEAAKTRVVVRVVGWLHSRALASVRELMSELRELGYRAEMIQSQDEAGSFGRQVVVAVTEDGNRGQLRRLGWKTLEVFGAECFQLNTKNNFLWVLGGDSRGVVYALSELRRRVQQERRLPVSLALRRQPAFPTRRWSTAVSHNFGSPWDERIHIAQRFDYIKTEVLPRAADYGMNSVELNGRPGDGWDIDWMIGFQEYPELASLFAPGVRRERLALVEDLARAAHDNLLEIFVWNHELHLPPGFVDLYPQVKGTGYPVCLSDGLLKKFLRDKYIEFFTAAPSIDGVVISVNESGQFSLLTDAGCRCGRCIRMKQHDRLMAVLDEVIAVASQLKKQIVLRTFQGAWTHDLYGHPELETIQRAYSGLPRDVQVMSKYCPLDFYGGAIADEPLIGVFPNSHLVELSLDVEWQGRTFVPVLTPENFRRRVAHASEKKCSGIVARLDFPFPSMEPQPIFGHPNEFNAWYLGELLWNQKPEIDDSLLRWAKLKYGAHAAPLIASALRKTEAITQKTFFALGQTLINYHNMLAGVSFCDNALWNHALSKWDPAKRKLSESFFQPDDSLIASTKREKQEAIQLSGEGLSQIHQVRPNLSESDYQRLSYDFEKLKDTAELWDYLLELYLRHRQTASSPVKPELLQAVLSGGDQRPLQSLLAAAQAALKKAIEMEHRHGKASWPVVSPDRGVSVYEFVGQILRHYIAGITREVAGERIVSQVVDQIVTTPVYQKDTSEQLWRSLVECARPSIEFGTITEISFKWPKGLRHLRIDGLRFNLTSSDGRSIDCPLAFPVRPVSLSADDHGLLSIHKTPRELWLEKAKL